MSLNPLIEPVFSAARVMEGFPYPWFASGGWAIDVFIGQVTRKHEDCEIGVFRQDQQVLQRHFSGWEFFKALD